MLRKSFTVFALCTALLAGFSSASSADSSTVAVGGYDVVSYFTAKRPAHGNGHFVSEYEGATYLFANAENKKKFDAAPQKFAPAFGGYCAYGVSKGKKFVADPEVWRIVNGTLYLNLDARVQEEWLKDTRGNIKAANRNWQTIKDSPAGAL